MSLYTVIFTPEAQEQMAALYRYIAAAASPEIAERYTSSIVAYCESLQDSRFEAPAAMTCVPGYASLLGK